MLYAAVSDGDAAIVQAISIDQRMELVTLSTLTYAIAGAGVLLAVGVAGWFVTGRLFSPLRKLRDTTDAITIADLGVRVSSDGDDEIADLTASVNSMLDRLAMSVAAQRQLLDDVRHELKTPITIVRGHLETMNPADPEDVVETRDLGISELDRLSRLVDDIDALADVEAGSLSAGVVDVSALTDRVGELVAAIPNTPGRSKRAAAAGSSAITTVSCRPGCNSPTTPRSTPRPAAPSRSAAPTTAWSRKLWVRDHGSGIPPAARHRVFRRFDRVSTRRGVDGSGLGLSIVDAIVKAHDGHCTIADTPGGGATLTLHVPLGGAHAPTHLPTPVRAGDVVQQREATG